MANTGIKTVLTLRKYVDGVATSEVKINDPADPDYIAPYEDLVDCPVTGGTPPTTDAPTTAAPTTDAPTTDAPTTDAPTTDAPTTDAPTTDAPTYYNYYFIRECFDGAISGGGGDGTNGDAVIRSASDLSGWSHILIPRFPGDTDGISEIYNVTNQAAYDDVNSSDYGPIDVDAISGVAQKTSCSGSTTQAPTTAAPSGDCTSYYLITGSGQSYGTFTWTNCDGSAGEETLGADANFGPICAQAEPVITNAVNASVTNEGSCGTGFTTAAPTTAATVVLTSFNTTSSPSANASSACAEAPGTTRWHDGANQDPEDGDTVYLTSNSNGSTIGAGYWALNFGYFKTDINGVVEETGLCP